MKQEPPGWPGHLHPYRETGHKIRVHDGVTFYPYDATAARVKSWVAIGGETYLGIIEAAGGGRYVRMTPAGVRCTLAWLPAVASSVSVLDEIIDGKEDPRGTQE